MAFRSILGRPLMGDPVSVSNGKILKTELRKQFS